MIRRDGLRDSRDRAKRDERRDSQKPLWDKGGIARDRHHRQDGITHPPYRGGYPKPTNEQIRTNHQSEGVKEAAA